MTDTAGNGVRTRWVGLIVTIAVGASAITVQWGIATARLADVEQDIENLVVEVRAMRDDYAAIERRVSYMDGRMFRRPGGEP